MTLNLKFGVFRPLPPYSSSVIFDRRHHSPKLFYMVVRIENGEIRIWLWILFKTNINQTVVRSEYQLLDPPN